MTTNLLLPILMLGGIIVVPLVLLSVAISRLRSATVPRPKKALWVDITCVASLPLLAIALLLIWFTADNFPFTSGVVAHTSSPNGEEVCVVQTFKSVEPYQVSLYARRHGQPWVWHYLAHQDSRWRSCKIDFAEGQIRVYRGSVLRRRYSVAEAVTVTGNPHDELPATYTPEQILARHNAYYHR